MRPLPFIAAYLMATSLPVQAQNVIPTDAQPLCVVIQQELDDWTIDTVDGLRSFSPPKSFAGSFDSLCAFYKWGAQMFLYLTSPGENSYVFDSPGFFVVEHVDGPQSEKIAKVKVTPNEIGLPNQFVLRSTKPDERGGAGQAGGGGVLLDQNGGLTYYGMHVNDSYVAFRNGVHEKDPKLNFVDTLNAQDWQFPSTSDDMDQVVLYGENNKLIRGNPHFAKWAGTLELKTSWISADTLPDDAFIELDAILPGYDMSSDSEWTVTDKVEKEVAMVGMHIAGPVNGHPELVWISYEHLFNSPIGAYKYTNTDGQVVTSAFSSDGTWLFSESGASWPEGTIDPTGVVDPDTGNIVAASAGGQISKQNVVQYNPWGNVHAGSSHQHVNKVAAIGSNTELVSLNASLIALLTAENANDPRRNYFQIGGVWTTGKLPTYQNYGVQRGGLNLANSTMETFHQWGAQTPEGPDNFLPHNCFDCHNVSGDGDRHDLGVSVSHIFQGMAPYKN